MLLKSKDIAFTGVMMALGVLLVTIGGYLEVSTLFFLAAASFLSGVVFQSVSLPASIAFVAGTTILGFILAPQKLYLATFFAFCVYVVAAECLKKAEDSVPGKRAGVWAVKAVLYHVLLGIFLFLVQKFFGLEILFSGEIPARALRYRNLLLPVMLVGAEVLWLAFDRAYFYFRERYGSVIGRLKRE